MQRVSGEDPYCEAVRFRSPKHPTRDCESVLLDIHSQLHLYTELHRQGYIVSEQFVKCRALKRKGSLQIESPFRLERGCFLISDKCTDRTRLVRGREEAIAVRYKILSELHATRTDTLADPQSACVPAGGYRARSFSLCRWSASSCHFLYFPMCGGGGVESGVLENGGSGQGHMYTGIWCRFSRLLCSLISVDGKMGGYSQTIDFFLPVWSTKSPLKISYPGRLGVRWVHTITLADRWLLKLMIVRMYGTKR